MLSQILRLRGAILEPSRFFAAPPGACRKEAVMRLVLAFLLLWSAVPAVAAEPGAEPHLEAPRRHRRGAPGRRPGCVGEAPLRSPDPPRRLQRAGGGASEERWRGVGGVEPGFPGGAYPCCPVGRTRTSLIAIRRGRVTMKAMASAMSSDFMRSMLAKRCIACWAISGRRWEASSVSTAPGSTRETRTWRVVTSCRSDSLKAPTPC